MMGVRKEQQFSERLHWPRSLGGPDFLEEATSALVER
jgi:hypothetical protein